jgi:hypothetical protein
MYGMTTLPNTGMVASGAAAGALTQGLWLALLIVTIGTVLAAMGRLTPRRES